jgi:hypothetical protein
MPTQLDEAEKQILAILLNDFNEQGFDASKLKNTYEGPKIPELSTAICAAGDVTSVDFDIALSDLEKKKYIRTGPFAAYDNKPNSGFIMIGGYSKREYCSLTELGYKAARQAPNRPSKPSKIVNNVNISGGSFSNFQLAAGNNVSQAMTSATANDDLLIKLIEIIEGHGQKLSTEQRSDLASAVEEATEGNGKEAKSLLQKVCGPAWEVIQPVVWPLFGELIKKSLGL